MPKAHLHEQQLAAQVGGAEVGSAGQLSLQLPQPLQVSAGSQHRGAAFTSNSQLQRSARQIYQCRAVGDD